MPEMDNKYADELNRIVGGMSQEQLVERIKMCQEICDHLESDKIWKAVTKDAEMWVNHLNGSWQEVYEKERLDHMKILKLAYSHVLSLPRKYKEDLIAAQSALDAMRNTDSSVQRDYDLETTMETT